LKADAEMVLATWHNALLCAWTDTPTVGTLRRVDEVSGALSGRYAGGFGSVSIAMPHSPFPDDAARKYAAERMRERDPHVLGAAVILEADGFVASAGRAVLTAMTTLSGRRAKTELFRDGEAAALWLSPKLATAAAQVTVEGLAEAIALVRGLGDEVMGGGR